MGATQAVSATSKTPVRAGRLILIHGYSASGAAFEAWRNILAESGVDAVPVAVGNYVTLNNEVSIKDLGEAFDRALQHTEWSSGGKDDTWTFDAIVHSTGMLVLRQWLVSDPYPRNDPRSRIGRLKHLVGFAPATFGSPQAKQGRSWLGALVKGSKDLGPDFLNAGDEVLDGLELGSRYTWELSMGDMVCATPLYDKGSGTPYVAVFIGNTPYTGLAAVSNHPGTDGTVRWAGCALNTRKVTLDLRRQSKLRDPYGTPIRCDISPWADTRLAAPMIAGDGLNHGTILSNPDPEVAKRVKNFLLLSDADAYTAWETEALAFGAPSLKKMDDASAYDGFGGAGWQQLVVHMVDDHGDGVTDYNVQLFIGDDLSESDARDFAAVPLIADTYTGDASYRCFYIRLSASMLTMNTDQGKPQKMWIELIASSGSTFLEYEAYTGDGGPSDKAQRLAIDSLAGQPVKLDITALAQGGNESLLYPYTTTMLEIFVEREPLPLGTVSKLFGFLPPV